MSEVDSIIMDPIDDVSTPTSSQEVNLLNDGNATSSNATNLRGKEKTTANLKDVKCIIDANNCGRSGELTISLDTGEVIIKPSTKRNRNRTSHQRAIAKNGGNSNVNPHDRINDSKSKMVQNVPLNMETRHPMLFKQLSNSAPLLWAHL